MYELPSFDQLVALNESNPQAFESLREKLVDGFIEAAPSNRQSRLQGLQFHIDSRRELAKNPLDSCICISRMMHETFWDMHDSLEDFTEEIYGPEANEAQWKTASLLESKKTADVLSLIKSN